MKLKHIGCTSQDDGSMLLTLSMVIQRTEELEETDIPTILDRLRELTGDDVTPEKPKRVRRTKAQIAADEAAAAVEAEDEEKPARRRRKAEDEDESEAEEKPARRRRRKAEDEDESEAEEKPARRRRRKAEDEDEEISDADLTKAASAAAREVTPAVVKLIVKDFSEDGSENVREIPQDKRREFLKELDAEVQAEE